MSFTVQTDPPTAGANAYVDVAYLVGYHQDRKNTLPGAGSDRQAAIIKATDALDTMDYIGEKVQVDQSTQWPRSEAIYSGIPEVVKEVCAELALLVLQGEELFPIPSASPDGVIRNMTDQVGPLRTRIEYFRGSTSAPQEMRFPVLNRLREVLRGTQYELKRV